MYTKLYNPDKGQMQVAGLISGSGSNLIKIIEYELQLNQRETKSPYHVAVIFTDNAASNAVQIASKYNLPVIVRDITSFYKAKNVPRRNMDVRAEYDTETVKALSPYNIEIAAFAGYMSIATASLIDAFLGINVHPADLSIMSGEKRKYTGDNAVKAAILAGERELRSTTHIIESKVDYGRILMISSPITVELPKNFDTNRDEMLIATVTENQSRLKKAADWIIFPKTLEFLAEGRFAEDDQRDLYLDNNPIPQGLRLQ